MVPLGTVDYRDMHALYKSCDLLISPSIYEGFPNVLLEAAYYGLPMISSRLEGVKEYFRDGRDILIVEKGDAKGLSDKIKQLCAFPEMRKRLSENAKVRAEAVEYIIFARGFASFVSSKAATETNLLKARA